MKKFCLVILVIGIVFGFNTKAIAIDSLQSRINSTPDGGMLYLEDILYSEPIVIKRPIHVIGKKGTTFQVCTNQPAITIASDSVDIENIIIEKCFQKGAKESLYITGQNHLMRNIRIEAERIGVMLEHTVNSTFQNIQITGEGTSPGVNIWESTENYFINNKISNVGDGFYLENSPGNTFSDNSVSKSRYGLHIMYSDHITVTNNVFKQNVTGAMVMETTGTIIENNWMGGNNQNVNAQGLLLYNVYDSKITDNIVISNRVGMYMENSSGNNITNNQITENFIGAQLKSIKQNVIERNSFTGNVNEIQAVNATDNQIRNNYWDGADKLDMDGDGKSDLVYHADPFFLKLIDETPAFQLFFQSPGMVLLQSMLKSPEDLLVSDISPLMINPLELEKLEKTNQIPVVIISFGMIVTSLFSIILGRRK